MDGSNKEIKGVKQLDKILPEVNKEVGVITTRIKDDLKNGKEIGDFDPNEFREKELDFWKNRSEINK